jgi:hypothetical protein
VGDLGGCQCCLERGLDCRREPLLGPSIDPTSREPMACKKTKRVIRQGGIKGVSKGISVCDITSYYSIVTAEGGEPCIGVEHGDLLSFRMITQPSE